jgi:acyl transferase domain-containing protein
VTECHGADIVSGGPVEAIFTRRTLEEGPVAVTHLSGVKSSLGHLEAAIGMAGPMGSTSILGGEIAPPGIYL